MKSFMRNFLEPLQFVSRKDVEAACFGKLVHNFIRCQALVRLTDVHISLCYSTKL